MSNINGGIAYRLQDLISESGLKIKPLAEKIGISTGALSNYQNDAATPGADAIIKIARYFNVSADWLLGLSKYRTTKDNERSAQSLGIPEEFVKTLISVKETNSDSFQLLQRLIGNTDFVNALKIFAFVGHNVPLDNSVMFSDGFDFEDEKPRRRKNGPKKFVSSKVVRDGMLFEVQQKLGSALQSCFGEK